MSAVKKYTNRAEDICLSQRERKSGGRRFLSHFGTARLTIKHWQGICHFHTTTSTHLADGDIREEAKFNISPSEQKVFTRCYYMRLGFDESIKSFGWICKADSHVSYMNFHFNTF